MLKERKIWLLLILITLFTCGTKSFGDEVVCKAKQAYDLRMEGKLDEAKQLLEKAIDEDSTDDKAYYELARVNFSKIYGTMNDRSKEIKTLQKLLKEHITDADKAIKKAIKLNNKNPRYHYFAGVVEMYDSIYDMHFVWKIPSGAVSMFQMLNDYEKALGLKPEYHRARLMVSGIYDRLPWYLGGSKAKAKKHVEQLKQMDAVYGLQAFCELRENDKLDKVSLWQELVDKNPDNADARQGLALMLLDDGQIDKAVIELEKAVKIDPSKTMLFLDVSKKLTRKNDYGHAEKCLKRFLEYEKVPLIFSAAAMRQLAKIKDIQGQTEKAGELRAKANEITPVDYKYLEMESLDLLTKP